MEKTSILITGGTGFIGANLVHALTNEKNQIHIPIRKSSNIWRLKNIKNKIKFHNLDLTNTTNHNKILKKINPELVFHCAAYGINHNENNFSKMIKTNIHGTQNLFSALSDQNIKKIVNIGSVFEYGIKNNNKGYSEKDMPNPETFYGITKTTQTNIAQYFFKFRSLPITTLRLFTPFGKLEKKGRLISDMMLAITKNEEFKVSTPNSVRDFIFIDDVVDAIIKAAKTPNINGEIFNIGLGKPHSVKKIIEICKKFTEFKTNSIVTNTKKQEYDLLERKAYANISKAKKKLKWRPKNSIEQGLSKSHKWYQKNISLYN